jgi:hypothetical protein
MVDEYVAGQGPFQHRQAIVAFAGLFVAGLFDAYVEWCSRALDVLDIWAEGSDARSAWGTQGTGELAAVLDRVLSATDRSQSVGS